MANIGEGKYDEAVIPLDGPNAPFKDMVHAIQRLENTVRNTPPQLINSKIKGGDLELVLAEQDRQKI